MARNQTSAALRKGFVEGERRVATGHRKRFGLGAWTIAWSLLASAPALAQNIGTELLPPAAPGAEVDSFFDDVWSGIKTGANAVSDGASTAWAGVKSGVDE